MSEEIYAFNWDRIDETRSHAVRLRICNESLCAMSLEHALQHAVDERASMMHIMLTLAICPSVSSVETIVRLVNRDIRYSDEERLAIWDYAEEKIEALGGRDD